MIDEFDYPLTNILEKSISKKEKEDIFDLFKGFYKTLLKGNKHLHMSIVTGTSRVVTSGFYNGFNNIKEYRLINGKFIDFYGFQQEEMDQLLDNLEFVPQKDYMKKRFSEEYSGYMFPKFITDENNKRRQEYVNIYNAHSVSKALSIMQEKYEKNNKKTVEYNEADLEEIFDTHWYNTEPIYYIEKIFSAFSFHLILKKLLQDVPIYSDLIYNRSEYVSINKASIVYDITVQNDYVTQSYYAKDIEDIVLSLLVSTGYLTFEDPRIKAQTIQLNENKNANKQNTNEKDGDETPVPAQQQGDALKTNNEGYVTQDANNKRNYAYKIRIPNNELRRGLQRIDDRLMHLIYVNHAHCFRDATNSLRDLLSAKSDDLIDSTLRKIFECFCILITREKKITNENMVEANEGIIFNERTLQSYMKVTTPRGDNIRMGNDVKIDKNGPDLIFDSTVTNRVVIIEIKLGKKKINEAYKQVHKYIKEAKDKFKTPEEVLLVGINYNSFGSEPNEVDLMNDIIAYKYSLHRYEKKDNDDDEFNIGDSISEGKGVVTYEEVLKNLKNI